MANNLECMSLNVRGINDNNKHKSYLYGCLTGKPKFILQETKLQEKCRKLGDFEWNGKCFHAFSDSAEIGVSIFIKKTEF